MIHVMYWNNHSYRSSIFLFFLSHKLKNSRQTSNSNQNEKLTAKVWSIFLVNHQLQSSRADTFFTSNGMEEHGICSNTQRIGASLYPHGQHEFSIASPDALCCHGCSGTAYRPRTHYEAVFGEACCHLQLCRRRYCRDHATGHNLEPGQTFL